MNELDPDLLVQVFFLWIWGSTASPQMVLFEPFYIVLYFSNL